MERDVTEVVAALIWRGEKFLICQRPEKKARGLLWEFVGGKVEKGESREDALRRECREELALKVEPTEVYAEVLHEYPDITVRLTLFCTTAEGEPTLLEHRDLRWITPAEIPLYDFCPADREILLRMRYEYAKKNDSRRQVAALQGRGIRGARDCKTFGNTEPHGRLPREIRRRRAVDSSRRNVERDRNAGRKNLSAIHLRGGCT